MLRIVSSILLLLTIISFSLEGHAKGKPPGVVQLKDANGNVIGRVIGMETVSWPYVLTDQGYRTLFKVAIGMVDIHTQVVFESTDCSGTAYVGTRYPGTVFTVTDNAELAYAADGIYYSPSESEPVTVNINSTLDSNMDCIAYVAPTALGYPAYPNDPQVTGISNSPYPVRMLIE